MATSTQVAQNIRERVHDDGFLGTARNQNVKQSVQDLKDLSPAERNEAVAKLTDADLKELADDVNARGAFGAAGLSADEKKDMFNTFAQGLNGEQLGRLGKAFDQRDNVIALGQSVAQHSNSATKLDFIKEMAPRTADGDTHVSSSVGAVTTEMGDKDAAAILEVLNSMGNDPAAFDKAVKSLDDKTLEAVAFAGLNQKMTSFDGSISVSHDPQGLNALADAASRSSDPAIKARVFEAGSGAMQQMRKDTGFPVASDAERTAGAVADKFGQLMNTDASGISQQLNDEHGIQASPTEWVNQLKAWDSMKMFSHYNKGNGRDLTLSEMGLSTGVKELVVEDGAFGREGSIQDRFIQDIAAGKGKNPDGSYTFENAYEFGDEMVWAMGGGMLKGTFKGDVIHNADGTVTLKGSIEYRYSDEFKDPYDTFDMVPGSFDAGGTPYAISETWTSDVSGTYPK